MTFLPEEIANKYTTKYTPPAYVHYQYCKAANIVRMSTGYTEIDLGSVVR
jgi:hypothetical protein